MITQNRLHISSFSSNFIPVSQYCFVIALLCCLFIINRRNVLLKRWSKTFFCVWYSLTFFYFVPIFLILKDKSFNWKSEMITQNRLHISLFSSNFIPVSQYCFVIALLCCLFIINRRNVLLKRRSKTFFCMWYSLTSFFCSNFSYFKRQKV